MAREKQSTRSGAWAKGRAMTKPAPAQTDDLTVFASGAKRSDRMPRYDLIPKVAFRRLAERFTGEIDTLGPTGGALKYGECNWMKGLPTSDVYNHALSHLLSWGDEFRRAIAIFGNDMHKIRLHMRAFAAQDDELAGALWGIAVLMEQEDTGMFHDTAFPETTKA